MELREREPLANHTSLHIGGQARWYAPVTSTEEIRSAIELSRARSLRWTVLGGGQSTLVADQGFDGVVIHCLGTTRQHLHAGSLVFAGDTLGDGGSVGALALCGTIPITDIQEFHWLNEHGKTSIVPAAQWNTSALQHAPGILLGIVPKVDIQVVPTIPRPSEPSAQVFQENQGKTAGAIADVGWAGKPLGKVQLWTENPTWLIAEPGATADEVVTLMSLVKQQVRDTLGVQLRDAICYLGM